MPDWLIWVGLLLTGMLAGALGEQAWRESPREPPTANSRRSSTPPRAVNAAGTRAGDTEGCPGGKLLRLPLAGQATHEGTT